MPDTDCRGKRHRLPFPIAATIGLVVLGGCPRRFDPRAEPELTSPNSQAKAAYDDARAKLNGGQARQAADALTDFGQRYPSDPLIPAAHLVRGRALYEAGDSAGAVAELDPLASGTNSEDPIAQRARYLLGFALHRAGDRTRSEALLGTFEATLPPGDDRTELEAVMADNCISVGDHDGALQHLVEFYAGARPPEKIYIQARTEEIVGQLSTLDAMRLWTQNPHDGLLAAYLGTRLAAERMKAGDSNGARDFQTTAESARQRLGLAPTENQSDAQSGGEAVRRAIGVVLPLSGKGRALGERVLRGVLLSAGWIGGGTGAVEVRVRDSGSNPERAVSALGALAAPSDVDDGVLAVVGSPEKAEGERLAERARELGVPLIDLSPDDAHAGPGSIKLLRPRVDAADALAKAALRSGYRSVGILRPDTNYGQKMAAAFTATVTRAGGHVAIELKYPESSTTFIDPVRKLAAAHVDAIFVPAPAAQLALIAPQLTSSGVVRMPNVKAAGKVAQLYATADGLNEKFLQSTGKYLQGAVLAPLYYPDPSDRRMSDFADRYRLEFNEEPSSLDALAFDALRAVKLALDQMSASGGSGRVGFGVALLGLHDGGLTGDFAFNAAGDRLGTVPLYLVGGDELNLLKN